MAALDSVSFVLTNDTDGTVDFGNTGNFVMLMSDLDENDLVTIFSKSLGAHFLTFEVEIRFHIRKLVRASVDINLLKIDGCESKVK